MSNIKISLLIASFITIITYFSQFLLLHINNDYSFISVVYHNFESIKYLSKDIVISLNILIDFFFYFMVLLLGFKVMNNKNMLLKYLLFSFVGIVVILLLYVSSINFATVKGLDFRVYEYIGNNHFVMFYLSIALLLLFIPLAFKNDDKINTIEDECKKLENENITTKYLALKNKLEPHFLFNSFSVLDALIDEDKEIAHKYLRDLSSIYRYILQDKEEVTLREALAEINNYISILQFRYGDGVSFSENIEKKFLDYKVVPMSIQILIENAVKHNTRSTKSPLRINLKTDKNGILCICNNIQLPKRLTNGNGLGLASLSKLYTTKWGRDITITRSDEKFCVAIPLIEPFKK